MWLKFIDWNSFFSSLHNAYNFTFSPFSLDNSTAYPPAKMDEILGKLHLVFLCVIFIVGLLGNSLVIYVTGFRMKRSVNSVWFLNLALADFLFIAFLIFKIISFSQNHQWPFGHVMCKLDSLVTVVNMFASIFLLTAISLDRCISIWVVVWAQNKRTVRKAQLISAGIWLTAVVCSTPFVFFRNLWTHGGKSYCGYPKILEHQNRVIITVFRSIIGFFIPFLVIFLSYVAIGVRTRRLQKTRKHRSIRMIFCIVFAFFICWLPFHILQFIELTTSSNSVPSSVGRIVSPLAIILAFTNSCLNPILYMFMCEKFQKKLKQSICLVFESALAEDHLSFMSSRSLSSHLSRISRKSDSVPPLERNDSLIRQQSGNHGETGHWIRLQDW